MLSAIIGGISDLVESGRQRRQAEQMRKDAQNIQKQALRPEFRQRLRMDDYLALAGLPGIENMQSQLDANTANKVGAIKAASGTGTSTLTALMAGLGQDRAAYSDLLSQDATAKIAGQQRVGDTVWAIGEKERQLEDIRDKQKQQQLQAAAAMENAATYNKSQAIKGISGGVEGIATTAITAGLGAPLSMGTGAVGNALKTAGATPVNTALSGMNDVGKVVVGDNTRTTTNRNLTGNDLQDMINKVISKGLATNAADALTILRKNYGFTINGI